jgi:hypothetical protein
MLKKVAKALDEMAKNEELMQGILAAAEDVEGEEGEEGEEGDGDGDNEERLGTIGENEEEGQIDTYKDPRGP